VISSKSDIEALGNIMYTEMPPGLRVFKLRNFRLMQF